MVRLGSEAGYVREREGVVGFVLERVRDEIMGIEGGEGREVG